MVIKNHSSFFLMVLTIPFIFLLMGCPGQGDRLQLDETTQVKLIGDNICFHITNARNYQPAIISINLRGTSPKKQEFIDNPSLRIRSEQLCIPPSFYQFTDNEKYIVEFVLTSLGSAAEPRKFVVGVGLDHGQVYGFPLTDREILRPYGSIEVPE
ncbi:putative T6SS immunity periplasmic lipoprotein [Pseudescherichia sp.]|uniref:putative T6SS immunity periplasmic lipoprotein n=1 Tax=Pseudescherichia sp. TaxID=2055881 RepID=UPI0028990E23|nr:putative T6SS immunity periplasmic lipoprotein [Pseudescherichia sp.]